MTRTVNCLEDERYVVRRPHETDGRQVLVVAHREGREILLADRRRRDAWLARRLRELTPDERALLREAAPILERLAASLSPTFRSLHNHNYRLYAAGGVVSNTGTWMQRVAQDWLVVLLAGNDGAALGITTGLQFLPVPAALAVRRPDRRPDPQAAAAPDHQVGDGRDRPDARRARRHRHRRGLARLRAGPRVRRRLRLRRPGAAELRQRDGRPRRPDQRRRPQLRLLQRRPHRRPGARRPADRRLRRRRGRDRLGDPAQRGQLRRAGPRAALDGRARRSTPPTRAPRARARSATACATCAAVPT